MDSVWMIALLAVAAIFGKGEDKEKNKIRYTEEQKKKILERVDKLDNEELKKHIVSLKDKEDLSDDDYFSISLAMFLLENFPPKKEQNQIEDKQ